MALDLLVLFVASAIGGTVSAVAVLIIVAFWLLKEIT